MIAALAKLLGFDAMLVKGALVFAAAFAIATGLFLWREAGIENARLRGDRDQLIERNQTDAEVDKLTDSDLCRELGGGVHCDN